ncbi:hypothetical protein Glove_140g7 [Diversispora epigaea]|uniref:Uncharacterized protein n=1 Tax=Diversispora epigaea TaxID=1348612 RepID=A0A397IZ45_9GLOM|nr:hypothetical protein Glove_140g7 [Diversispora epigaea]
MVTSGKKKPRNDNVNVKIKISNKIKRVIVTLLKISVAYKNKGGKIIKSAKKVIMAISFLDSSLKISCAITIDPIIEPLRAIETSVNLVKPLDIGTNTIKRMAETIV